MEEYGVSAAEASSTIRIARHHAWADSIRWYKVIVDGDHVGDVGDDSAVEVLASPGRHELYLKIAWCRSPVVQLELRPGETTRVECASAVGPLNGLWLITFGRHRYIDLHRPPAELRPGRRPDSGE